MCAWALSLVLSSCQDARAYIAYLEGCRIPGYGMTEREFLDDRYVEEF